MIEQYAIKKRYQNVKIMGAAFFWSIHADFGFLSCKVNHGVCPVIKDYPANSFASIRLIMYG